MLLKDIPGVLTQDQLAKALMLAGHIKYVDGGATGASIGQAVKRNQQMHLAGKEAGALVDLVRDALLDREEFTGAVFPMKMHLNVNRYADGMHYGRHNDAAVVGPSMADAVRTDISFTVFLAEPDDYDGGEMVIQTDHGEEEVKLAAGDAIVYEGSMVHEVRPVTRGARLACFGWAQSFIRDPRQREMLARFRHLRMDIIRDHPDSPYLDELGNIYNNLMRMWSDA